MILASLLAFLLQFHLLKGQPYEITFERTDDFITLKCRNTTTGAFLQVDSDQNTRFWLNRTKSARPEGFEPDLRIRLAGPKLTTSVESLSFVITVELEGRYTCGRMMDGNNAVESTNHLLLVSLLRTGLRFPRNFAAESRDTITIPCPYEVGKLFGCYFGSWTRNNIGIVSVGSPGLECAGVQTSDTIPSGTRQDKYSIDRRTFNLTIADVDPSDSGNYTCLLSVVNPASSNGQTKEFTNEFAVHTLAVDEAPSIKDGPDDVIVDMDPRIGTLLTTVSFDCTAIGLPVPEITWSYDTTFTGKPQDLNDQNSEINSTVLGMDSSGHYMVSSKLVLFVSPTDGGTVSCITGDDHQGARLTVLGAPLSIEPIISCGGTIVHKIRLPVSLNHPARLIITYVNDRNEIMPPTSLSDSALMEINDTNVIFYEQDASRVPFSKYRVRIALSVATGSRTVEGPAFTSKDKIDAHMLPPGVIIGLITGFAVLVVLVALFISVCLAVCCIWRLLVKFKSDLLSAIKKNTEEVDQTHTQVRTEGDCTSRENSELIKKALEKWKTSLENALKTANQKLENYGTCLNSSV